MDEVQPINSSKTELKIPNIIKIIQPNTKNNKEYKLTKRENIKDGVESLTYETDKKYLDRARVEITDPKKAKISILYKEGNETISNILKKKKATVLINGTFRAGANSVPQGNIKGENLKNNKTGIYKLVGNNAAANGRAFFGISKDGKLEIQKGGNLDKANNDKYSQLISGLIIISDNKKNNFKSKNDFLNYLKANNDPSSLKNIFRTDNLKDNANLDNSKAPRTAVGITKDNKLITLTIGKGVDRYGDVSDVYSAYKILHDLGAVAELHSKL